jgi:hypothetical protein
MQEHIDAMPHLNLADFLPMESKDEIWAMEDILSECDTAKLTQCPLGPELCSRAAQKETRIGRGYRSSPIAPTASSKR